MYYDIYSFSEFWLAIELKSSSSSFLEGLWLERFLDPFVEFFTRFFELVMGQTIEPIFDWRNWVLRLKHENFRFVTEVYWDLLRGSMLDREFESVVVCAVEFIYHLFWLMMYYLCNNFRFSNQILRLESIIKIFFLTVKGFSEKII